ncbi:predicted protein, partial [Nematostella vectensis]
VCRSFKSPWICLRCGIVHCGRYVNAHAKSHCEKYPQHSVCLDQSLAAFCYSCDEFIINDTKGGDVQRVREIILERQNREAENAKKKRLISRTRFLRNQQNIGRIKQLPGLRNLGNTCFMNAVLQSLSNIQTFSCYFKDLPAFELRTDTSCEKNPYFTRSRKSDDGCLVEELRKVLCALWQGNCVSHSPEALFSTVWKVVPRFRGYQQQDAHEFMHYLMDRLHTELLLSQKACFGQDTIVTGIFGGILQSEVTCLTCMTESRKLDPFLDLSLEIPPEFQTRKAKSRENPFCQLEDCMKHFVALEKLAESELYMCLKCKKKEQSTKKFWIQRLPNVLCLHLKRFRFQAFLRSKIDTYVQFPIRGLDMSPYTLKGQEKGETKPVLYDLAAVVVHHGSGVSAGHYTTFAFHDGAWYNFNDSSVSRIDEEMVAKCKGYIFFYTRRHPDLSIIEKLRT